jgi:hypothetical protein
MPPPPELLADVDLRIAAASRELAVARERFPAATPGPGRVVREAAEAMLDELLELRHALTHDGHALADDGRPAG